MSWGDPEVGDVGALGSSRPTLIGGVALAVLDAMDLQGRSRVSTLPRAMEQSGKALQAFRNRMNHLAYALRPAMVGQNARTQHEPAWAIE